MKERTLLAMTLRRENEVAEAERIRRASSSAELHSANNISVPAVNAPSISVRTDTLVWPIFQVIPSKNSSSSGSTPPTHDIRVNQMAYKRSSTLANRSPGNAARGTVTAERIATNAISTGKATRITGVGC